MRFSANTILLSVTFCATALPLHADGPASHQEIASTQEPLLSTQELDSLASRCSQEIEALHEKRRDIAREKAREFSVMLGVASDDCIKLKKVVEWLRVGGKLKTHYQKHLALAQGAVNGTSPDLDVLHPEPVSGGHTYDDDVIEAAPLP